MLFVCIIACTPKNEKKEPLAKETVSGNSGNFIRIKGHGFSNDRLQNVVKFGDVKAVVVDATPKYLLVKVPPHKAGTVPVMVIVGEESSNPILFEYNSHPALLAAAIPTK
ncbi:IPT/TIG domain-containing protein [Chitinophaga sp. Cy-1792]|uniref:IPT/TIG domain-containing protein n=1 Tax=Chitinophaga sp. Cy-1792 TaxID=2608339 RepID=UPI0014241896|nr:IPT/TIG domain-containing protein [Chitinophaga sp. Cy-1792]